MMCYQEKPLPARAALLAHVFFIHSQLWQFILCEVL